WLTLAALLVVPVSASAEIYYGRNPNDQGALTLVGFSGTTTYTIQPLPSGTALTGSVAANNRAVVALTTTREFKLTTSAPVMAVLGYDCCNFSGGFFFPALDGRQYYAKSFIFTPLLQPVSGRIVVFTREAATVTLKNLRNNQTLSSGALGALSSWVPDFDT